MNGYQRALLICGGGTIAIFQLSWIIEEGLDDSKGWWGALVISIILIFLGFTSDETFKQVGKGMIGDRSHAQGTAPLPVRRELPLAATAAVGAPIREPEGQDEMAAALRDHVAYAQERDLYDPLAGTGKSITWCCALSLYGSLRLAASTGEDDIDDMVWNSIVHRASLDMMSSEAVSLSDARYATLEKEAYAALGAIDRVLDESPGSAPKVVERLSRTFGCHYRPDAVRALEKIFSQNVTRAGSIIPYFTRAFD